MFDLINQKYFLTNADCKNLNVNGGDELSSLNIQDLLKVLVKNYGSKEAVMVLKHLISEFNKDRISIAKSLRWFLRGLSIDHSITKVKYNNKIYKTPQGDYDDE